MNLPVFVISDIHAFDGRTSAASRPSFFDISVPRSQEVGDPISDLKKYIRTNNITASYLVVCGDLGDKAQPLAVERAWEEVQGIKELLKAQMVIATVGNHDVDSRHIHNDHDAKGLLLDLVPGFPFECSSRNNQFWTHHYCCLNDERTKTRFIVLNSSAYHGEQTGPGNDAEYTRGRISDRTLRRLRKALEDNGKAVANVLVCHHHPQKHDEHYLGDYDDMRGGSRLLASLDSVQFGPWLIIHGHKHHPKISYAQGGTATPVVFAAGSCAAVLQSELHGHARNQVYRIEIEVDRSSLTSTCSGVFQAWDWAPGAGWKPAGPDSGLPATGGFGFRGDLGALAEKIKGIGGSEVHWRDVQKDVPQVRHLLPTDLKALCAILQTNLGVRIEEGKGGGPLLIQK